MNKRVLNGLSVFFVLAALNAAALFSACKMEADAEVTYTVVYHSNYGSGPEETAEDIFTYGGTNKLRNTIFERPEGLYFAGWALSSDGPVVYSGGQTVSTILPDKDVIPLFARWGYHVIFESDGAYPPAAIQTILKNDYAKDPVTVSGITRGADVLAGWYIDDNFSKQWNFKDDPITGEIHLYAKWDPPSGAVNWQVSFNSMYVSAPAIPSQTVADGKNAKAPDPAPVRKGYTFIGWYSNAGLTIPFEFTTPIKNDTPLYAKWEGISYTVTYNANGGGGSMSSSSFKYGDAKNLRKCTFINDGHDFAGWAISPGGDVLYADEAGITEDLTEEAGGTVTLYAIWTTNSYTVIYNNNGGTGTMGSTVFPYGSSGNLTKNTFTRTGYGFEGWAASSGGSVEYADEAKLGSIGFASGTRTITLYAKWKAISFKVSFDANEGSGAMSDLSFEYDVPQKLASCGYSRTGYKFAGWSTTKNGTIAYTDGQNNVSNLTTANGATVTLYAVWNPISYTVTYNRIEGSGAMDATTHTYGVALKLRKNTFARTGYLFDGWAETQGGVLKYTDEESVTNLASTQDAAVPLYARWKAITYTVHFDTNYPAGSAGQTGSMSDVVYTYDGKAALASNAFGCTGYDFDGWNTAANGSGTSYANGTTENLSSTDKATVNLFAKWKIKKYTVTFNSNGGSSVSSQTVDHGGKATNPTNPTKSFTAVEGLYAGTVPASYTFGGWYNGAAKWDFTSNTVTGDITLTANWPNPYEDLSSQSGNTVEKALAFARSSPKAYTLVLGNTADYPVTAQTLNTANLKLTITGLTSERTISLSTSTGMLFTLGGTGVELNLGDNITLVGRGTNSITTNSVVKINAGAVFTTAGSSKITGNTNNSNGGGVYVDGGTFTMNGGTVTGNTAAADGGGVYVNGGTFTMNGGTISNNKSNGTAYTNGGGGVFVNTNGIFSQNGGTISGNSAEYGGGVNYSGTFTMNGGDIFGNTGTYGGGVYIRASPNTTFTMNSGNINGNTASEGAGLYCSASTGQGIGMAINMTGGSISYNAGREAIYISTYRTGIDFYMDGGAISGNSAIGVNLRFYSGSMTMSRGEISGNGGYGVSFMGGGFVMTGGTISNNHGGVNVIYGDTYVGTFTMEGGTISGNTTDYYGAGVYNSSNFSMSGGTISGNKTINGGGRGGGVYNTGGFSMTGGVISGNTSNIGGGVYLAEGAQFDMGGTATITANVTEYFVSGKSVSPGRGCGVYVSTGAEFTMSNGTISYNTDTSTGGGVYVDGTFKMTNGKIINNSAGNGGGVFIYEGTFTITGGQITGNTDGYGVYNCGVFSNNGGSITGNSPGNIYNW